MNDLDDANITERQRAYTALAWMVVIGIGGALLFVGIVAWAVWQAVAR